MTRFLNTLTWVGVAVVFAAAAVRLLGWFEVLPVSARLDQYAMYATWSGLAVVLLCAVAQWPEAGISALMAVAVLVGVNYVSSREYKRWDLTANKQLSLSDQTLKLLTGLASPLKLLVFADPREFDRFRDRLTSYEAASRNVSVEYVDRDRYPLRAREYDISQQATVVVDYMGRRERVTGDTEQDITSALIKAINPAKKKVYFLTGHGEKDTNASPQDREGINTLVDALRRDNYEFDSLVLAQAAAVPADATVLIEAGPRSDLLERELPVLEAYLEKSGKLLVMLDPPEDLKAGEKMPLLVGLLGKWGIKATASVVVDLTGSTNSAVTPAVGPPYASHPITNQFQLVTVFPLVRAMTPEGGPEGHQAQPFVQTRQASWAEADIAHLDDPAGMSADPTKGDLVGPVTIAAAVAVPAKAATPAPASTGGAAPPPSGAETRIAAIGDADFITNAFGQVPGNVNLAMNTINWLGQQESLISIRPRDPAERRLTMSNRQMIGMLAFTFLIVPAGVFGAGIYAWARRR